MASFKVSGRDFGISIVAYNVWGFFFPIISKSSLHLTNYWAWIEKDRNLITIIPNFCIYRKILKKKQLRLFKLCNLNFHFDLEAHSTLCRTYYLAYQLWHARHSFALSGYTVSPWRFRRHLQNVRNIWIAKNIYFYNSSKAFTIDSYNFSDTKIAVCHYLSNHVTGIIEVLFEALHIIL